MSDLDGRTATDRWLGDLGRPDSGEAESTRGRANEALRLLERLRSKLAAMEAKLAGACETCGGTGVMEVLVDVLPPDGKEVYEEVACGECGGTGKGKKRPAVVVEMIRCDFCGATQWTAALLIKGKNNAAICSECVVTCNEIIAEHLTQGGEKRTTSGGG